MNNDGIGFGEYMAQDTAHTELANVIYDTYLQAGRLPNQVRLRLTYRCYRKQRCAVMHVIDLPHGRVFGFPRYKTSEAVTQATSSEAGRANNTEDGDHRWKSHASFVPRVVSDATLACDHLNGVVLDAAAIEEDLATGHADVRVRPDGSRYAV